MPTFASIAAIRASIAASRTASDGYTACVGLVSEGCPGDGADPGSGAFIERTMIPVNQPTNPSTTAPGQPHMAAPMTTPATRNAQIIVVLPPGLPPFPATAGAATSAIFENVPRRNGFVIAAPSRRLKKLPHSPRSASGITGTGSRSTMRSMPLRKGLISPVSVILPSGKIATSSPARSAFDTSSYAASRSFSSSFAGAIGIALPVRKTNETTGILKIRWSITNRIGRGLAARITSGSTKLTWLHTSIAGPSSGMFSRPDFSRR